MKRCKDRTGSKEEDRYSEKKKDVSLIQLNYTIRINVNFTHYKFIKLVRPLILFFFQYVLVACYIWSRKRENLNS